MPYPCPPSPPLSAITLCAMGAMDSIKEGDQGLDRRQSSNTEYGYEIRNTELHPLKPPIRNTEYGIHVTPLKPPIHVRNRDTEYDVRNSTQTSNTEYRDTDYGLQNSTQTSIIEYGYATEMRKEIQCPCLKPLVYNTEYRI